MQKARCHFQMKFNPLTTNGFPVASEAMSSCKSQNRTQEYECPGWLGSPNASLKYFFFKKLKNQEATEYFELEGLTLTCVDTFKKVYFQKQMESSVPG